MRTRISIFVLCIVAGISAATTFVYFDNYAAVLEARNDRSIASTASWLFLYFVLSGLLIPLAAAIWPKPATMFPALIHAASYVSLVTILAVTSRPGHGSAGAVFVPLIWLILVVVLAFELAMIAIALSRKREQLSGMAILFVFPGLIAAFLGGWFIGMVTWSETLPQQVVAAAEKMAVGRPYCLEANNKPVDSRRELTALLMLAPSNGGFEPYFHSLMVIGSGDRRVYANWSFRKGGFELISDRARAGFNLDDDLRCTPTENFPSRLIRTP